MDRTSIASPSTTYRAAASWPGLLGLRTAVVRWLFAQRPPRRSRDKPLPAPVLQFGMQVDGRAVRGTRWGHGPLVYLTPDATGRPAPHRWSGRCTPADPEAGRRIAGLLAGRRVRF